MEKTSLLLYKTDRSMESSLSEIVLKPLDLSRIDDLKTFVREPWKEIGIADGIEICSGIYVDKNNFPLSEPVIKLNLPGEEINRKAFYELPEISICLIQFFDKKLVGSIFNKASLVGSKFRYNFNELAFKINYNLINYIK